MAVEKDMETTAGQVVEITPAAIKHAKYLRAKKGDETLGVRIGVKGGGCSGLSYVLMLEAEPRANDVAFEVDGVRIFIDPKSARFLEGTTLDYSVKNLLE